MATFTLDLVCGENLRTRDLTDRAHAERLCWEIETGHDS
jgi:hypothetical protein